MIIIDNKRQTAEKMNSSTVSAIRKTKRTFQNYQSISEHLFCSICQDVFENPQRLRCGHTFCFCCIIGWSGYNLTCPLCKDSLKKRKLQPDIIARKIIDDLIVECKHEECSWEGTYSLLKKHQRICKFKPKKDPSFGKEEKIVELGESSSENSQQIMELRKGTLTSTRTPQQNLIVEDQSMIP